jgi:hypothetical protein
MSAPVRAAAFAEPGCPTELPLPAPAPAPTSGAQVTSSELPDVPREVEFTPAEPSSTDRAPGTGWLQPGGLVVHTGWVPPYPDRRLPYHQTAASQGSQSWHVSTPTGREVAVFYYFTPVHAAQAAAAITATLPQGVWPPGTPDDDPLYEAAVDASTGPWMLPKRDSKGRPDWGRGASKITWRMPSTRTLYDRMIAKHGGLAPATCEACRETVRHARRTGWITRTGHWPTWGAHAPGSTGRAHCPCQHCLTFVTIGALGTTLDTEGRTVPGVVSACIISEIWEGKRPVPHADRPLAWWRHLLTEYGHAILDNRRCAGLWPEGVRHDDAFLCETGLAGLGNTGG